MSEQEPHKIFYLKSHPDLQGLIEYLKRLSPSEQQPWTVTVSEDDESRSLKQNRLAFLWFRIRGEATGHGRHYERCLLKYLYGIPILRERKEFNEFYEAALDHLDYQQKLDSMEFIPVTSLMTVKEFVEFLNIVDQESASIGIVLPRPSDLYDDALMIHAEALGY